MLSYHFQHFRQQIVKDTVPPPSTLPTVTHRRRITRRCEWPLFFFSNLPDSPPITHRQLRVSSMHSNNPKFFDRVKVCACPIFLPFLVDLTLSLGTGVLGSSNMAACA